MLLGPIILLPLLSLGLSASLTAMLCERHAIHKHRCHVMQYGNEHENHVSSNGFVCPYNNLIFYRFFEPICVCVCTFVRHFLFVYFVFSSFPYRCIITHDTQIYFSISIQLIFYPRLFSSFSGSFYVCAFSLHRSSWFILQMCFTEGVFFTLVGIGYKQICFFMLNAK